MAGVIQTGTLPKLLWPGIKKIWGTAYNDHKVQYTDLFEVETSDKKYEEFVEYVGFGLAPEKPEGQGITYDTDAQGPVTRLQSVTYALGFMVTREAMKDNLYMEVARRRVPRLARSMRLTKETVHALVYSRAFTSTFTGGDAKELCATDHPTFDGTQSNELTNPANLSEAAIEDMLIQIGDAKDSRGEKIAIQGKCLVIPTALQFEAHRILKSVLQNDTAMNAVNAIRSMGMLPDGIKVNNFLISTTNWFVRTDAPDGMISLDREPIEFGEDGDFDTHNQKYQAYERYIPGWGDWRGLYGTPGV